MKKYELLETIRHGLIVSCQAIPSEPHFMPGIVCKMAECAEWGGAKAVRVNSPEDIRTVKKNSSLPIIGLWKIDKGINNVYLTPSLYAAQAIHDAGADIIVVQGTHHLRTDGKQAYETIREVRECLGDVIIFADVATVDDAIMAVEMGADIVAPTLSGYFHEIDGSEPNYKLLQDIVEAVGDQALVVMEGGIATPFQACECIKLGAYAVVVGNAITRPHITTQKFSEAMKKV